LKRLKIGIALIIFSIVFFVGYTLLTPDLMVYESSTISEEYLQQDFLNDIREGEFNNEELQQIQQYSLDEEKLSSSNGSTIVNIWNYIKEIISFVAMMLGIILAFLDLRERFKNKKTVAVGGNND